MRQALKKFDLLTDTEVVGESFDITVGEVTHRGNAAATAYCYQREIAIVRIRDRFQR